MKEQNRVRAKWPNLRKLCEKSSKNGTTEFAKLPSILFLLILYFGVKWVLKKLTLNFSINGGTLSIDLKIIIILVPQKLI